MKKPYKKVILWAAAAAALAGGAGTTIAYFTDTETKVNVFTMGDLVIDLSEPEWDPTPENGTGDGQNMYPGYTVYKNPTIKNVTSDENGDEPCYARIRIRITDHDGELIQDGEVLEMINQMIYFDETYDGDFEHKGTSEGIIEGREPGYSLKELSAFPTVNPVFVKDEQRSEEATIVYNYMGTDGNGILRIGEEAALFTNIAVPTDWNQMQISQIGDFRLDIEAECIQCGGFAAQEEAFLALDQAIEEEALLEWKKD